ncbi:MAG TPA: metallophosphoesterase family protein [Gaiella sp.]|nr:metallophosphoesterase family protein [Gaiella sp.]
MRVAALYDVHANLPALEAVLAEVEQAQVDTIVAGGDVVWGPMPAQCLALLRDVDAVFVAGNCERTILAGESDRDRWCREMLGDEATSFLAGWPLTVELDVGAVGHVLFCHATPRSDDEILTRITPDGEVVAALRGVDADVVVCGHTHVQYDRRPIGVPRLVNVGSVGLCYQGEPGTAAWALVESDVELRRTRFDTDRALEALLGTGFPGVEAQFGPALRGEHGADDATEWFESRRGA